MTAPPPTIADNPRARAATVSAIRAASPTCSRPRCGSASPTTGCARCSCSTWSSTCSTRQRAGQRARPRAPSSTRSNSCSARWTMQPLASQIYGFYTGLVYLTPIFGGLLADRVLGQRRTVILGAVLMAIGHFMMAFEPLFLLALARPDSRQRRLQAEHLDPGRRALRAGRPPPRPRLLDLLRRHQSRRVPGAAGLRHARRGARLALRLRRRRRRHDHRARRSISAPRRRCRRTRFARRDDGARGRSSRERLARDRRAHGADAAGEPVLGDLRAAGQHDRAVGRPVHRPLIACSGAAKSRSPGSRRSIRS